MLFATTQGIAELACMYPVTGGFYTLSSRFIDPSLGFAVGWNYWFQWVVTLPLELVAASFTLQFWDSDKTVNIGVWITIFAVVIIILNVCVYITAISRSLRHELIKPIHRFGTWGFAEEGVLRGPGHSSVIFELNRLPFLPNEEYWSSWLKLITIDRKSVV